MVYITQSWHLENMRKLINLQNNGNLLIIKYYNIQINITLIEVIIYKFKK